MDLSDCFWRIGNAVSASAVLPQPFHENWKVIEVARRRTYRFAAEPLHAQRQIHRETDARLLAVADNVHPGLNLSVEHRGDGAGTLAVQGLLVNAFTGLLAEQQFGKLRWPGQAAAM